MVKRVGYGGKQGVRRKENRLFYFVIALSVVLCSISERCLWDKKS